MTLTWDSKTEKQFKDLLEKIPVFMRPLAQDKVSRRADQLAQEAKRTQITEKDLIDAFFIETPFGFHGPMKNDMEILGIDYQKYGHPK